MDYVKNWTAKRAGGRITITGELNGSAVKITNVDTIKGGQPFAVATDKGGATYHLGSGSL